MEKDPISQNISGVQSLVGSKLNKIQGGANVNIEGVVGEFEDELTLKLTDDELLSLSRKWEDIYRGYEAKLLERQQKNETYYLGKQKDSTYEATNGQPISANLLFEAEETFIPAALAKNPEPVVWSDNSNEGNKISNDVKTMLQYHAATLVLRKKLSLMTRHWSINFIGVAKHGWDDDIKDITTEVRNPRNFIFDPTGFVDSYGDYEGPLGERITVTAQKLIDLFPKHSAFITIVCNGKLGTDVTYTEWWNDDYCFYTFKGKVLEKNKNPHFNYPKQIRKIGSDGLPEIGDDGNSVMTESEVYNHFAKPKKPYTFLTVFSLGTQPHDITGLIEQNIPNQRRLSRRTEQIDYNLSRANNSDVFSENNFNQETAKQAASAMAKGHPVLIPSGGPIGEAVHRLQGVEVGTAFFSELENSKNDLRSIFGTIGITAQPPQKNELATGEVLNNEHDNSRIGGGIGDAVEQVASNIFNWWVQLYSVYYDEPHFAAVMGKMKAVEYIELRASDINKSLVITVSPDSMKSHDELTEMNQALTLWRDQALDIKSLLTVLNFPDPQETAAQAWLYHVDPMTYGKLNFPELAQQVEQMQLQQQQAQMAQQQQQLQLQGAQGEQQIDLKNKAANQTIQQKEESHRQKLVHTEEIHKQKQRLAPKESSNVKK